MNSLWYVSVVNSSIQSSETCCHNKRQKINIVVFDRNQKKTNLLYFRLKTQRDITYKNSFLERNNLLKRIVRTKTRQLQTKSYCDSNNFRFPSYLSGVVKRRSLSWAGGSRTVWPRDVRSASKLFVEIFDDNVSFEWPVNNGIILKRCNMGSKVFIHLVYDKVHWRTLLCMVINQRVLFA